MTATPRPRRARASQAATATTPRRAEASNAASVTAVTPTRVLQQFRIVFNAVKTHFQQVERQAGVGGAQVWALSIIRDKPGIGVNGLASALNIRQPTASNLVRNLVLQSLIEVRREGTDRRAVQLHATPVGRKMLRRSPGPFAGVLPQALAELDPQVLERMHQDLTNLIRHLDADESAASIPLAQL